MTKQDQIAAGIIALVQSALPFLILIDVLHWTADTTAAAMLVTTNIVTLGGLFFQSAKTDAPAGP